MIIPKDGAERWKVNEPLPSNFDQSAYQKRINEIAGSIDGRPIIKLAWAPQEFRWWPHPVGTDPPGYVFPIFHAYTDSEGNLIAAPRWVLLERIEPAQYAPTEQFWEAKRYSYDDGILWDFTGPIPSEKYVELRCHSYHDGLCCPCIGDSCECGIEYAHCWGRYAEPNERLLDWIRKKAWETRHDKDVNPTQDIRVFEAAQGQRDLASMLVNSQKQRREDEQVYNEYMLNHWERKPHSTNGIILLN
jgi:hypothetical protein